MSTSDQSVALQLDGPRRLADQRGWTIAGKYIDHAVSVAKDRRPELDRLMKDAHHGKLDLVACWRFDRFARSVRHLVMALDEFRSIGVDFISVSDGIDTSTPAGRFSFTIIAAVAEAGAGVDPGTNTGQAARLRANGRNIRQIAKALAVSTATVHRGLASAVTESLGCLG